jgi:hypothetical protein
MLHVGNRRLRALIQSELAKYVLVCFFLSLCVVLFAVNCFAYTWPSSYNKAESKAEKSSIVTTIVADVRLKSPLGGFVKNDLTTGYWWEVGKCYLNSK